MRAVAHAALMEGVPCMLGMILAQIAFTRRRREAWSKLRAIKIAGAQSCAGPHRASIANAFESDDGKQTTALVIMC